MLDKRVLYKMVNFLSCLVWSSRYYSVYISISNWWEYLDNFRIEKYWFIKVIKINCVVN